MHMLCELLFSLSPPPVACSVSSSVRDSSPLSSVQSCEKCLYLQQEGRAHTRHMQTGDDDDDDDDDEEKTI